MPFHHTLSAPLASRAGLQPGSNDHLRLLRNRFLLLHWVAREVAGGEILDDWSKEPEAMGASELQSRRLRSSACFGFLPLVTHALRRAVNDVGDEGRARRDWVETLSGLLLLQPKEMILRRYLGATAFHALCHGPEIKITRLSLARTRRDGGEALATSTLKDEVSDPQLSVFAQVRL